MATKFEKAARVTAVSQSETSPPIPEFPKLPEFFKERFPDKVEEIDLYNAKCVEFFKKRGTFGGD